MTLKVAASPTIYIKMTLEAPEIVILTTLEVSFRLLETMYAGNTTGEVSLYH